MIILLKVIITVTVVATLSIVAERISPRAAGILSGYPLGSAISLFFIGLERSAAFAGESALYAAAGMTALLSFFFAYYHASRRIRPGIVNIALSSTAGAAAFLAVNTLLHGLNLGPIGCAAIGCGGIYGYGRIFHRIPDTRIVKPARLDLGGLVLRAGLAAGVILGVTGLALVVPPSWAGLFTAFPATVFPLVLILHATYSAEQAHTVIKNLPTGLWALVLYALTVSYTYPRCGIYWGTLIGFGAATIYLLGFTVARSHTPALKARMTHKAAAP